MQKHVTFYTALFISFSSLAQVNIDSLWKVWNDSSQFDTSRLNAIRIITWDGYLFSQPDSAFYFAQLQYDFAESINKKRWMAEATNAQGISFAIRGDNKQALKYFEKSLESFIELGNKKQIAGSYNNIGNIYKDQGNLTESLNYFQKSLILFKEIGDKKGVANRLSNIGLIFQEKGNYEQAIQYHKKSLKISDENGDQRGIAGAYNNIAINYKKTTQHEKAINYYREAFKIFNKIGDKRGVAGSLHNIGTVSFEQSNYDSVIIYCTQSLNIRKEIGDQKGIASSLNVIGNAHIKKGNSNDAINFYKESLNILKKINTINLVDKNSESLYKTLKQLGEYEEALEMHELFLETKDSLSKMDAKEDLYKFEIEKEFELAKLADSLLFMQQIGVKSEQIKTQNEKIKREKSIKYSLFLGMLIVSASLLLIFKNLKKTKKQKGIIEDQKAVVELANDELEEKNQEIIDSINYAKRIQLAILHPMKTVKEHFKDSFILYKPKDIVAGDFYWLEKKKGKVLFAAADCTGHGVPGAMVSVICNNGLNRSVREHNLTIPGDILDKTREIVVQEFQKSDEDVKDGMDIALCSIDGMKLQYAGAYNPLWIIRNGKIIETKGNKQPIGQFDHPKPYTTHSFNLEKGDTIYIFSDGYVDQFGGERGKKFKGKALRKMLLSIQKQAMEDQKITINKTFETWKGNLEQIDDVCIIGVRI